MQFTRKKFTKNNCGDESTWIQTYKHKKRRET